VQLLGTEDDIFQDRQIVGQHEVLENHPDASLDRIGG
jgi:hypothetical protein